MSFVTVVGSKYSKLSLSHIMLNITYHFCALVFGLVVKNWIQCCTPVIPALGGQRQYTYWSVVQGWAQVYRLVYKNQ